jgi:hypothetical protein
MPTKKLLREVYSDKLLLLLALSLEQTQEEEALYSVPVIMEGRSLEQTQRTSLARSLMKALKSNKMEKAQTTTTTLERVEIALPLTRMEMKHPLPQLRVRNKRSRHSSRSSHVLSTK